MQEVLKALNRLVADGIVENYAIGGAVGASFYIEAVQTEDVDAFVFLPPSFKTIASLSPIYQSLQASGGTVEKEHVRFGEWPLQILPDANPLISEAIRDAVTVDFNGTPTRVFRAEHLCAIALQTGRVKDNLRVTMFLQQQAVNLNSLNALATQYGLVERLRKALEAGKHD